MRKQIAIFSILMLVVNAQALEKTFLEDYKVEDDIRTFKTTQSSDFQVLINSKTEVRLFNKSELRYHKHLDRVTPTAATMKLNRTRLWLVGSSIGDRRMLLFNENGEDIINERRFHDRGSFLSPNKFYSTNSFSSRVYTRDGEYINLDIRGTVRPIFAQGDVDTDIEKEIFLSDYSDEYFSSFDTSGKLEWRLSDNSPLWGDLVSGDELVTWNREKIGLRHPENSSLFWQKRFSGDTRFVVPFEDKIAHPTRDQLVLRDLETGEVIKRQDLESEIGRFDKFPDRDVFVGYQGESVSFFDSDGEKLGSFEMAGLTRSPDFTQYDEDEKLELAVAADRTVHIIDVKFDSAPEINQSLNETVFVGNGKELLKAVALDRPVFVSDNYNEVAEEANVSGLKPIDVGDVDGIKSVENVNTAFNVSRPKYFVEDQEKAVYVAALAAKNNASLTFEKERAGRDFSNYSLEELQQRFVDEFKPNHIVVADLDSDKGILAAYMAVRQGSLPVDFGQEVDYSTAGGKTAGEINEYNGVISLDEKIEQKFEMIGENRETVFDGKYISLLDASRKVYEDPVEGGLINDPKDGSYYTSDLSYGNLDSDRMLEAGVGRYPEDASRASLVFHRSMEREIGEKALVSSEYLHSNWPVILATFGGGMRHGKVTSQILQKEGFNTVHLIERRSKPVSFLFDLIGVPTPMDGFVKTVDSSQQKISSYLTKGSARAIKNAAYMIRGLKYAEQALQMYFEFEWASWNPMNQELDIPDDASQEEFRELILSFLPTWKTKLTEENLVSEMEDTDIIYYQGVGNQERWAMPNNDSSKLVSNRYNGTNRLEPEEIPELEKPIVFDSSNLAGSRGGEMRNAFFDHGASAFVGFTGVNYAAFSSHIDQVFFRTGKTTGNSLKAAINSLRSGAAIFHPSSAHVYGVSEKMRNSAALYGNPEMKKDPINQDGWNITRRCDGFKCEASIRIEPEMEVKKLESGKKILSFNTTDYLLTPGAPITPLYSKRYHLPVNSSVRDVEVDTDYKPMENVYLPETHLLSHGGNYSNLSDSYEVFPENLSNTRVRNGELKHVQAGLQKDGNTTKVLESLQVNFSYTAPLTTELSRENRTAFVKLNSRENLDAKLIYRIKSNKSSRKIEIEEGRNRFKLGKLPRGTPEVELFVVKNQIISQASKEFQVAEPLEIYLFAPDIHAGDAREVKAVVENPNNFSLEEDLEIRKDDNIQLGFLEPQSKHVEVPGNGQETVSWRIVGVEIGKSEVSVRNSSEELEVLSGRSTDRFIRSSLLSGRLGSPIREFEYKQEDSRLELKLETDRGKLRLIETPRSQNSTLVTQKAQVEHRRSPGRVVRIIESMDGKYREVTENGLTRTGSDLPERRVNRLFSRLDVETSKLRKFYMLRKSSK